MNEQSIQYEQQGDYNLPCLTVSDSKEYNIGVWGQRRRRYLKENHRVLYYNLLTSGKLYPHLEEVENQAQEMFYRLVNDFAKTECITEQLKATDTMAWVGRMNNIRERAAEIVNSEIIFA